MSTQKSLSYYVTLWTALAIALGMGVYAVFQYYYLPGVTIPALIAHHLWHVAALGVVIYVFCWLGFRRILLRPLNRIYLHLYKLGTGELEPLRLSTKVRELQTIVDGVNVMIRRLEKEYDAPAIRSCQEEFSALRKLAKQLHEVVPEEANEIQGRLAALEQLLLAVTRMAAKEPVLMDQGG